MEKTYYIKTFGCQMNDHDSAKIGLILSKLGYTRTETDKKASLILINTCSIREKPEHKAFSEIGWALKLKKRFSPKIVGVCGCVAQQEGEKLLQRFKDLDLVFGPDQIYKLPQMLKGLEENSRSIFATDLINSQSKYNFVDLIPLKTESSAIAYTTIMKGCDNYCSYCIVPEVRGREVSRPKDEIIAEIKNLVSNGVKEVTLLGQNVNSYGCMEVIPAKAGIQKTPLDSCLRRNDIGTPIFVDLIQGISQETEIQRIRFISPHPKDLSDELIDEYKNNPKLCRHIHLPVQAGSNNVLKAMNRRYTREQYFSLIKKLKAADSSISITTDMIVGFPGETKRDFDDTLDLVERVQFDNMYAFAFSPRPGTKACKMNDDVPPEEKAKRLQTLLDVQNLISKKINESIIGKTFEVLVEGPDRMGSGRLMGRTSQNKIVNFAGQKELIGNIVSVEVAKANINSLEGNLEGKCL